MVMKMLRVMLISEDCFPAENLCYHFTTGHWGPIGYCVDYRRQSIIDGKAYMASLEIEHTNVLDDLGYFEHLFTEPRSSFHGFFLLYDVASQGSYEFVSKTLQILTRILYEKKVKAGPISKNASSIIIPMKGLSQDITNIRTRNNDTLKEQSAQKTFTCFPQLPTELQLAVLQACLTSSQPIEDMKPHLSGINLNVLRVCKLFHEEGSKIFWNDNVFLARQPIYLVGDLTWSTAEARVISSAHGQALANRFGCTFVELSSQSYEEVKALFIKALRACIASEEYIDEPSSAQPHRLRWYSISSLAQNVKLKMSRMFRW
ncbi:hypothetical protein BJY04DRAFT_71553 [Aspergillus karnatakaensis]|uniref:uncharacterized protein n=1 Tax=Aspergillus karnatakaensis TaxID=1810916 RepID=UPI003CCE16DC